MIERLDRNCLLGSVARETGLHRYRFQDPRLGRLLHFLEVLRSEVFEVDTFARRLLRMTQNLRDWVEDFGSPDGVYAPYRDDMAHFAAALTRCHSAAFRGYLDLVRAGAADDAFWLCAAAHVDEARRQILSFDAALGSIEALLDGTRATVPHDQLAVVACIVAIMQRLTAEVRAMPPLGGQRHA